MSGNQSKLKILLFGAIGDEAKSFLSKLTTLHASKAGPFDAAFCVGAANVTKLLQELETSTTTTHLPLQVYLQESVESIETLASLAAKQIEEDTKKKDDDDNKNDNDNNESDSEKTLSPLMQLKPNLYVLRNRTEPHRPSVWSIPIRIINKTSIELVVAACPSHLRSDSQEAMELLSSLQHVSYRGCDLLLSTEWPQGIEHVLPNNNNKSSDQTHPVSFDVADVALKARARYHIATAADQCFVQSPAFGHLAATTNTTAIQHSGRFVALGSVVDNDTLKQRGGSKATKFVHALGMKPLMQMSAQELQESTSAPPLPCPFTDAAYQKDAGEMGNDTSSSSGGHNNTGLSEASARRILAEERSKATGGSVGSQRWATKKKTGGDGASGKNSRESAEDVDPDAKSLFVHGLHKDVTGLLQSTKGDALLLKAFQASHKATQIRKPPNAPTSSFAFVDFDNHEDALACWQDYHSSGITVSGVDLEVRWATQKRKRDSSQMGETGESMFKRQRLTEAEARDSCTVYYKLPAEMKGEREDLGETLRTWMEKTLEDALAPDDGEGGERVTAADEPALRVQKSLPTEEADANYGFLEFASHAAASMALATLTGSTDGGPILMDAPRIPGSEYDGLRLHWGHGKKTQNEKNVIEDTSGFKFERKHFPSDGREDCWFCLASSSCEKHLITGVYDQCYSAMPKGPIHRGHLLLIPVKHTGQGALMDAKVGSEMENLKARLCQHVSESYDMDLFVFERAIATKGGYHTHVNVCPVPRQLGIRLQATMMAQAKKSGLELREIKSDLGVTSLLSSDGGTTGYFYAEIIGTSNPNSPIKRFLHQATNATVNVPLQFGREVLAAVLGKPELAHWKSCVASKEEETKVAADLREALAKYIST